MYISSRKNSKTAHFRRLAREKAYREEQGEFVIEGAKLCLEAVRSGLTITAAFITEAAKEKYPEVFAAVSDIISPDIITDDISGYISDTKTPQGVFLTAKTLDKIIETDKIYSGSFILLDGLQDAGNIGTIIRTCDALGISGVILSKDCADIYSPKTVRGAMGSLFRLPLFRGELTGIIERLKAAGFKVYAAALDDTAQKLSKTVFSDKSAVIIGNEGNGVSAEVIRAAGEKLYIPIKNAESLNAGVAAAIISWEITKQAADKLPSAQEQCN